MVRVIPTLSKILWGRRGIIAGYGSCTGLLPEGCLTLYEIRRKHYLWHTPELVSENLPSVHRYLCGEQVMSIPRAHC